jgi:hypothetical protein
LIVARRHAMGFAASALLFAPLHAEAQSPTGPRPLSETHRFELGLHFGLGLSNPGVVREEDDKRAAAVVGIDVRYHLWPLVAVGVIGQTTSSSGASDSPVQDAFANVWFRLPVSFFRPWVTFGFGGIRSALASSPATDVGVGIDWCLERSVDRYACPLLLTAPGILIVSPTRDTHLGLDSFFLRLAFQP